MYIINMVDVPDEYEELEYIQSTGIQWIYTPCELDFSTDIIELIYQADADNGNGIPIGNTSGLYLFLQCGRFYHNYPSGTQLRYDLVENDTNKHIIRLGHELYGDNIKIGETTYVNNNAQIYLFSYRNDTSYSFKGKIYKFTYRKNNILLKNYVPAKRKSDNVLGMYDTVNRLFHENVGTGTFIAGPIITKSGHIVNMVTPNNNYQELEYIETTNSSQMIDTGYADGLKVTVNCHMYATNAYSNYWYGSTQQNAMMYNGLYNRYALEYNWLTIGRTSTNDIIMTQKIVNDNTYITMNNVTSIVNTGTIAPTGNLYIFGCNNGNRGYGAGLRCYYFSIYDNNKLVRHFVPVKRVSDNVIGLYDIVTKEFYENLGDSSFTPGPVIRNYILETNKFKVYDNNECEDIVKVTITNNKFNVSINNPSAKTQYLLNNDKLYMGVIMEEPENPSNNYYVMHHSNDGNFARLAFKKKRHWKLVDAYNSELRDLNRVIENQSDFYRQVTNLNSITFDTHDDDTLASLGYYSHGIFKLLDYEANWRLRKSDWYFNMKFILISGNTGRVYKTICRPIRVNFRVYFDGEGNWEFNQILSIQQ